MKTFKEYLDEVLKPEMGAGEYVKDFKKSDAPQFKGKSMEKRREMAIAAYMAAKRKNEEVEQLDEIGDTKKGQKLLQAVNKRAVARLVSKRADTDPAYAKKAQQTHWAADERLKEEVEEISEISKELARKYMSKAGKELDKGAGKKADKRVDGYWGASERLSDQKPTSK